MASMMLWLDARGTRCPRRRSLLLTVPVAISLYGTMGHTIWRWLQGGRRPGLSPHNHNWGALRGRVVLVDCRLSTARSANGAPGQADSARAPNRLVWCAHIDCGRMNRLKGGLASAFALEQTLPAVPRFARRRRRRTQAARW
jgi:hypothetical protein